MEPLANSHAENLIRLRDALAGIGIKELEICTWRQRQMLRARVQVNTGRFAGTFQRVGWSFPDDSQPYPEYAPHWFHVAGKLDDGKGGACERDHDENGNIWVAWSRPVGASWVGPYRTPQKLLRSTVARFWKAVK